MQHDEARKHGAEPAVAAADALPEYALQEAARLQVLAAADGTTG